MVKLLVLYVFHLYNDRVEHFLKNCIFDDDGGYVWVRRWGLRDRKRDLP